MWEINCRFRFTLQLPPTFTLPIRKLRCQLASQNFATAVPFKCQQLNFGLVLWISIRHCLSLPCSWTWFMLAPASEAYAERVFSVCGDLTTGKRNCTATTLECRVFLKMDQAVLDLLPWWWRSLKYYFVVDWETFPYCACAIFCIVQWFLNSWQCGKNLMSCTKNKPETENKTKMPSKVKTKTKL